MPPKKESSPTKAEKKLQPAGLPPKWGQLVLTVIVGIILIVFVVLVYLHFTREKNIARYLPADSTVAIVALRADPTGSDFQALNNVFLSSGSGSLLNYLGNARRETSGEAVQGRVALAWMNSSLPVIFQPYTDKQDFLSYLKKLNQNVEPPSKQYEEDPIWTVSGLFGPEVTLLDNYAVFALNEDALKKILDVYRGRTGSLDKSDSFMNMEKNAGLNQLAWGYLDYPKALKLWGSVLETKKEWRDMFRLLSPLTTDVQSLALTLSEENQGDSQKWQSRFYASGSSGLFSQLVPERRSALGGYPVDATVLASGSGNDLFKTASKFIHYLGQKNPESEIILEGLLDNQVQKYLGPSVHFSKLADLNAGNYTWAWQVLPQTEVNGVIGVLNLKNEVLTEQLLTQWFEDFQNNSDWLYSPEIRELVLPDGTTGKEVYLAAKGAVEQEEDYKGAKLHYLKIANEQFSPGYMILDGKLYVFSHLDVLKNWIEKPAANLVGAGNSDSSAQGQIDLARAIDYLWPEMKDSFPFAWLIKNHATKTWQLRFFDTGLMAESVVTTHP